MKLITFVLLLTTLCFAADPPKPTEERFPISQEYMTLFNGLLQNMQAVQKQVQAAEEKLRGDICKEHGIAMADCNVDWQAASVSKRAPVAAAVPKPEPKKPEPAKKP